MKQKCIVLPLIIFICCGCNSGSSNANMPSGVNSKIMTVQSGALDMAADQEPEAQASQQKATEKQVIANEIDPVCGMPLTRGYEDTTLYKSKVIGFCSKECKADFVNKPKAYKVKLSQ